MFATQQYMDAGSDRPGKRGRDDEQELVNGPVSFSEHRNKRLQSLPLRTSPKAAQQWPPSATVTPLNSSPATEHVAQPAIDPSSFPPEVCHPSSIDAEMDMTADAPQMHTHAGHLGVGHGTLDATARMPTPIQPSFAAQVRGQQCEWAESASVNMQPSGPNGQSIPRSMGVTSNWQSVQNNRRLPSPISECDDVMSSQFQDPQDMPDHCAHSIHALEGEPHGMEHPNAMMDLERPRTADADGSESPGPSPNRRGHMRSKHTINTWTWQPGMKRSFSIGYRADCEKCRLKVPGHFNHIIIS